MIDTFSIRCSILRLAFSGKLSEQREAEGTAKELLLRISPKKSIEKTENTPYEIPDSWVWVRIADLYKINPKVEASESTKAAFIPMERISAGFDRSFSYEAQNWEQASKNHTRFADGDVAFAKITPCFENRKSFIAQGLPNGIGGGTTELIILRQSEMLPEYTYFLLLDQRFISTGKGSYKGTVGQQRVQSDVVKNYLVPVPPYAEQKRIVERIEQAFSVLDIIDALQAQYADNRTVLKAKLIDLAIRGKLTEQLPEDGTAEELYQQIQAEKQALIKAGKIKKEKPMLEINDDEPLFEIPPNWMWVRFGEISNIIGTGLIRASSEQFDQADYYYLKMNNIGNFDGRCHFDNMVMVNATPDEYEKYKLEAGDFLFNTRNSKELVGKVATVSRTVDRIILNNNILKTRFLGGVSPEFIVFFFISSTGRSLLSSLATSTTNVAAIYQRQLVSIALPLPPLAEQKRIVERLDQILAVCNEL